METGLPPPIRPTRSRSGSARVDYFDTDRPGTHTEAGTVPESPPVSEGAGTESSNLGALVEDKAEEDRFNFAERLRTALNQRNEEGIKVRELGVGFVDLTVQELGAAAKYQPTIFSLFSPKVWAQQFRELRHPPVKDILAGFTGTVQSGEMLLVPGSPGSGCTTFLKVIANQRQGYHRVNGELSYGGISPEYLAKHYRGDVAYSPEVGTHFPSLTVKHTLAVAAKMRTPQKRVSNASRKEFVQNIVQTLATVFGLRHTFDTPVGDESIRGVSGGEKKRASIAEMMATRARMACWDNSTRVLDSSTALEFVRALRIATDIAHATTIVTIYQASEPLYQLFDKVCVIYSGRQIYYGPANDARQYFIEMGWEPANRQTTADFLVTVTDPLARTPRKGWEDRVPRAADEFARRWEESPEGRANRVHTEAYLRAPQDRIAEKGQEYEQSAQRLKAAADLEGRPCGTDDHDFTTSAYFSRGGVLFFSVLFGALSSMLAIDLLITVVLPSSSGHAIIKQILFNSPRVVQASDRFIVVSTISPATLHIIDATNFKILRTISSPDLAVPVFSLSRRLLAYASAPPPPCASPTSTAASQSPSKVQVNINMAIGGARKVGAGMWSGVKTLLGDSVVSPSPASQSPSARSPTPMSPTSRNLLGTPRMYSRSAPADANYCTGERRTSLT
ncbi:ABC transporter [Ceratobasidium sp. AG-Ba]|nr:ABC transporter [Ceratobasidium sp. AG-Ba]